MSESAASTIWVPPSDDGDVTRQQRRRGRKLNDMMSFTAQIISERGYHMTSLDDIAERMDLSKASIYHYFDGKEALVMATLESCASFVQSRLESSASLPGTATERLEALIRVQIELISVEAQEVARLFLQPLDWPPPIAAAVLEWQRQHGRIFRDVIHDGVQSGEFDVSDERIARMTIQGAMNQVPLWYSDELASKSHEKVLADITATLMRVVLPAGTR